MNEDNDSKLIARFQSGDPNAFSELFEVHHARVLSLALHVVRNQESALDVGQEVFLRAYEELPDWRGEAKFSTWLYRTALNCCFERFRAEEKQRKIRDHLPEPELGDSPEVALEGGELRAVIDDAVKTLPPRQRMIFVLKQYEEMRFHAIATLLDITEGGAKASYHKALMSLRERLRDVAPESPVVGKGADEGSHSGSDGND